jgi:hypothetical protein
MSMITTATVLSETSVPSSLEARTSSLKLQTPGGL